MRVVSGSDYQKKKNVKYIIHLEKLQNDSEVVPKGKNIPSVNTSFIRGS